MEPSAGADTTQDTEAKMKKFSLDLEALTVDSFYSTPEQPRPRRGTVHGQVGTTQHVLAGGDTQDARCGITAYYTCTITEDPAVCAGSDTGSDPVSGYTVYGVSCGPIGSCSVGC
jgi:hypothetical protein